MVLVDTIGYETGENDIVIQGNQADQGHGAAAQREDDQPGGCGVPKDVCLCLNIPVSHAP